MHKETPKKNATAEKWKIKAKKRTIIQIAQITYETRYSWWELVHAIEINEDFSDQLNQCSWVQYLNSFNESYICVLHTSYAF